MKSPEIGLESNTKTAMIDLLNARLADAIGAERDVTRRHVYDLASVLGPVLQHEATVDLDPHALKVAPFSSGRRIVDRR